MEIYLEKEAKRGNEAAILCISGVFYPVGCNGSGNDYFISDPKSIADILDKGKPEIFVHSHLDCSTKLSDTDLEMKKLWPMDWWVYSIYNGIIKDMEIYR